MTYFRLVAAVRSTESLAMPVAPHQLDWNPPGLMADTLAGLAKVAVLSLVKALQAHLERLVSV